MRVQKDFSRGRRRVDFESQPLTLASLQAVVTSQSSFVKGVENVSRKPPLSVPQREQKRAKGGENTKKKRENQPPKLTRDAPPDATISFASSRVIRTKNIRNRLPLTCR